jgi:hypothetical protein
VLTPLQTLSTDGRMIDMADNGETLIYDEVAGGADLMRWFGQVPSFHDAEILKLVLCRKGRSFLHLHNWTNTGAVGQDRYYILDRHAIVTFTLKQGHGRATRRLQCAECHWWAGTAPRA